MKSNESRVRDAIRSALNEGDTLYTPDRPSPFVVESFDEMGLKVRKPKSLIFIRWGVLDGVPAYMARFDRAEVAIGAKRGWADAGTLERFLQDRHGNNVMRASYVAPILKAAGVCEILPKQGREKQRIRLNPEWSPG